MEVLWKLFCFIKTFLANLLINFERDLNARKLEQREIEGQLTDGRVGKLRVSSQTAEWVSRGSAHSRQSG